MNLRKNVNFIYLIVIQTVVQLLIDNELLLYVVNNAW